MVVVKLKLVCRRSAVYYHTGSDCVTDSCDPEVCCETADVHCDDNNACTDDSCDGTKGCQFDTIVFYDDNACTDDTCDSTVGYINTLFQCYLKCWSELFISPPEFYIIFPKSLLAIQYFLIWPSWEETTYFMLFTL